VSAPTPPLAGEESAAGQRTEETQNIATAIAEVSERATLLVREEIELAKAEVSEKATKLVKGAVVGAAAGVFFFTALVFALVGCAWLLYFYLPLGNDFSYFYGFFAMAVILVVLGAIAGLIAAKVVKRSSPPVPNMAIEEARKIREAVGPNAPAGATGESTAPFSAESAGGGS
jgi:Putative Actinobacterial Holin-X, holin superfamily III